MDAAVHRRQGGYGLRRFDLLVFDLDGTLIDSLQDLADSVNAVLEHYAAGPLPASLIREFIGGGAPELVRRSLAASGIEGQQEKALTRFLRHYQQHCLVKTRPYPGIARTLARLHTQVALAVLTNKPYASTRHILDSLHIGAYFKLIAAGDTFAVRKPDPRGLQAIMRQFQTAPGRTLMVGDSQIDMETGKRAGTWTCGAGYGMKAGEIRHADLFISTPQELESLVNNA
ncbi:MAG: HAD-IA family hydrolase [Acidobacteria bacterium]|nr:HAD-IA family hydrolase [Acidobacteriota bacterium]